MQSTTGREAIDNTVLTIHTSHSYSERFSEGQVREENVSLKNITDFPSDPLCHSVTIECDVAGGKRMVTGQGV